MGIIYDYQNRTEDAIAEYKNPSINKDHQMGIKRKRIKKLPQPRHDFAKKYGEFADDEKLNTLQTANINSDNYLVIDPDIAPQQNDIVIAIIEGETTVKRYVEEDGRLILKAENPKELLEAIKPCLDEVEPTPAPGENTCLDQIRYMARQKAVKLREKNPYLKIIFA